MTGVALSRRRCHRPVVLRPAKARRVLVAYITRLRAWDMICWFPCYTTRAVVAGRAGPRRDTCVIKRRRDPGGGVVTTVTGG